MKNLASLLTVIALVLVMAGCATPETSAYKTVAVIAQTVDSSRQAWNSYVAQGKATRDQVVAVHLAYVKYQSAMAVAEAAVITYKQNNATKGALDAAMLAVSAASADVITAVATFSK